MKTIIQVQHRLEIMAADKDVLQPQRNRTESPGSPSGFLLPAVSCVLRLMLRRFCRIYGSAAFCASARQPMMPALLPRLGETM